MKLQQSEHDIQASILNYLPYLGVKAIRINSGMIAVGEGKYRHMIRMAPVGTPDILGCTRGGRMVCIEVKKPGNKPTPAQEQVMEEWKNHEAIVFVATCIEDVEKNLKTV